MATPFFKSFAKTNSRAIFGNRTENGLFQSPYSVSLHNRVNYTHIRTVYTNGKSRILYAIPFDLDFANCESIWTIENKISLKKLNKCFETFLPELLNVPLTFVRSPGGKGVGLLVHVCPFAITNKEGEEETRTAGLKSRFRQIQKQLIDIFKELGIGVDSSSQGLNRFVPNWKDPSRLLQRNQDLENKQRREKTNIQKKLTTAITSYYKRRRLYNDERVEYKILPIFERLYEESIIGNYCIELTRDEFLHDYGLDTATARKIIAREFKDLPWLHAERRNGTYILTLTGTYKHWAIWKRRALELRGESEKKRKPLEYNNKTGRMVVLPHPNEIEDGKRNHFLWSCAVLLASRYDSVSFIEDKLEAIAEQIDGYSTSRNCRSKYLMRFANWAVETAPAHKDLIRIWPEWLTNTKNSIRSPRGREIIEVEDPLPIYRAKIDDQWVVYSHDDKCKVLKILALVKNGKHLTYKKSFIRRQLSKNMLKFGCKLPDYLEKNQGLVEAYRVKGVLNIETIAPFHVLDKPVIFKLIPDRVLC